MPASKSSKPSRISKGPTLPRGRRSDGVLVFLGLAAIGIVAAWWFYSQGYVLYYGDAEAHLNTAFKHFYVFVEEFDLIEFKDLQPQSVI